MIRRAITLGLCVGAFWLGMSIERQRLASACRAAGTALAAFGPCAKALQ